VPDLPKMSPSLPTLISGGHYPTLPVDFSVAVAMRKKALLLGVYPAYLLAPEVAVLLGYIDDLRQLTFFELLWNTGARPNEALALTPENIVITDEDGAPAIHPFIVLRTLKQRHRGRGRPKASEPVNRLLPLMDQDFVTRLRQFVATFAAGKSKRLWPESDDTIARWLQRAVQRARRDGVTFTIPVTPKTLRHSFAMHLLFNGVHPKFLQGYMGHRCPASTEVYTKILMLDVGLHAPVTFSASGEGRVLARRLLLE
jgi:integrase